MRPSEWIRVRRSISQRHAVGLEQAQTVHVVLKVGLVVTLSWCVSLRVSRYGVSPASLCRLGKRLKTPAVNAV